MKKLKLSASKAVSVLFRLFIIVVFCASSVEVKAEFVLGLYGYQWSDGTRNIYILDTGEIIIPAHNEIIEIQGVESAIDFCPYVDELFRDGHFNRTSTQHADRTVTLKYKKRDFKKECFALVPLISSRKQYYPALEKISSEVGKILSAKNNPAWPLIIQSLFDERKEKLKLRAALTYWSYIMSGGKNQQIGYRLGSISEVNNLHLYSHNWLMDNKRAEINEDRVCMLTAGGEIFADIALQSICSLPELSSEKKVRVISKLSENNALSYLGQIIDCSDKLPTELMSEEEFLKAYKERAELLSGTMYGFSTWLGNLAGGNGNDDELNTFYRIGYLIGSALQVSNDLCDFSPWRRDAFKDVKQEKLTAPVYYLAKYTPGGMKAILNMSNHDLVVSLVASGAFEKSLSIAREYRNEAKQAIRTLPESPERDLLSQSLAAVKSNQYLDSIKRYTLNPEYKYIR